MSRARPGPVLLAPCLVVLCLPASAGMFSPWDTATVVERSDLIVVGKVGDATDASAAVSVTEVLKGRLDRDTVTVEPNTFKGCVGTSTLLRPGDEAVLFLKDTGEESFRIFGYATKATWVGARKLHPETREKRLAEIRRLAEAERRVSDVRRLASEPAPKAVPRLAEAARDANPKVAAEAAAALSRFDTSEAVKALVALTRRPESEVRLRAYGALSGIDRPEAGTALLGMLDDAEAELRSRALGLLLSRGLAAGNVKTLLPRFVRMLDDPNEKVREKAVTCLGECRVPGAVGPLLKLLGREKIDESCEGRVVEALRLLYMQGGRESRDLIDADLELVIASLDRGRRYASLKAVDILRIARTPEAIAALERAATGHPSEKVREKAREALGIGE